MYEVLYIDLYLIEMSSKEGILLSNKQMGGWRERPADLQRCLMPTGESLARQQRYKTERSHPTIQRKPWLTF